MTISNILPRLPRSLPRAHSFARSRARRWPASVALAVALATALGCSGESVDEPLPVGQESFTLTSPIRRGEFTVTITNDDPALPDATILNLVDTFFAVYPRMRSRFNPQAPLTVNFVFKAIHTSPATGGFGTITFWSRWFIDHPQDWDVVTHESMHILQTPNFNPPWLTEGISDYVRNEYGVNNQAENWFLFEQPGKTYTEGYRHAALFLIAIEQRYGIRIVDDLTAALLASTYSESLWVCLTGKSLNELWNEYRPSLPLPVNAGISC